MISPYRRWWLPDLIVLLALMVATTLAFSLTTWDLQVAALWYEPGAENPWPHDADQPWRFFYRYGPWLVGLVGVGCIVAAVMGSLRADRRQWRLYALFVALSLILGPGVVVNGIFKDHWGRPRPRETVELGGKWDHRAPLIEPGISGRGKSFPAGHSSPAFALCVFYFLLRRRHPRWAFAALGFAIAFGAVLGLTRMRGGAHFLSDVLWSAWLPFAVSLVLYHFVLRVPWREDEAAAGRDAPVRLGVLGFGLIGVATFAMIFALLLANPVYRDLAWHAESVDDGRWRIRVPKADIRIEIVAAAEHPFAVTGHAQGFGLPSHRVQTQAGLVDGWQTYRVVQEGTFSELETDLVFRIRAADLRELEVDLDDGDILVHAPAGFPVPRHRITSKAGRVVLPGGW